VQRTAGEDDGVEIVPVDGAPRDDARRARREHRPSAHQPPHKPKPYSREGERRGPQQGKPFRKKQRDRQG
jgi:ATP-dependent RNA helicase DeaD